MRECHGPLDHHEAFLPEECSCGYCTGCLDVRQALDVAVQRLADTPCECLACKNRPTANQWKQQGAATRWAHAMECRCELCDVARAADIAMMAAQHRRDLWSEISYHATHDPILLKRRLGEALMEWIASKMAQETSDVWWVYISGRLSIGHWVSKFEKETATVPAIEG